MCFLHFERAHNRDTHSNQTNYSLVTINIVLLPSMKVQIEKANKKLFFSRQLPSCKNLKLPLCASQPAAASTHVSIYLQASTGSSEKNQGSLLFNDRINPGGRLKKLIS